MAKKERVPMADETQKKLDKYVKAVDSEKKGKKTAGSIIFSVLLIFLIIFAIFLKNNQKGKTIVFEYDAENPAKISAHAEDISNVSATNLAEYLGEKAASVLKGETTTETTAETTETTTKQ